MLPGVDHLIELARREETFREVPHSVLTRSARETVASTRRSILDNASDLSESRLGDGEMVERMAERVRREMAFNLIPVVNAAGVVVHTNLGRSPLAESAVENIGRIARGYSNLEFDLDRGERGSRYTAVADILCEVTGAPDAMVVNNNAAAVLLCLETLARGREVIVSRGELVEIGGAFRIPDVMARSGAILREVGTTNRTHPRDYETAVGPETGLLLKVHKSNYAISGFTREVSLRELVEMGGRHGVPVMEDLGSGTFIDFSRYGMAKEPTVQESVAAGADVVTFSGDKLLGGPQAGIIVGDSEIISRIKKNPITRALRIDKMTLAGLETTLRLYRDPERAVAEIPTLSALTLPLSEIEGRAASLKDLLSGLHDSRLRIDLSDRTSRAGGGALPLMVLPTRCLDIRVDGWSANRMERFLRRGSPPVIGRIEDEAFLVDPRTLREGDAEIIRDRFAELLRDGTP